MAHNLEFNEDRGTHSFFNVNDKAWHGLGQFVTQQLTSEEAIKEANLDFLVDKIPARVSIPSGRKNKAGNIIFNEIESDKQFAIYRTDKFDETAILGYVGDRYHALQNHEAFEFFDNIVGSKLAIYETAGVLGNGERVFITAKLPNDILIAKNDLLEQYIFLTNSHDGTGAVTAAFTTVRIVCNNTLNLALKNCTNKITLRHTANMRAKLAAADKIMGISHIYERELTEIFGGMASKQLKSKDFDRVIVTALAETDKMVTDYFKGNASTRFKGIIENVKKYVETNATQMMDSTKGTAFGAYNAVTGYHQNVKDWRNESDKFGDILDGRASKQAQKAFDMALELTFGKKGGKIKKSSQSFNMN